MADQKPVGWKRLWSFVGPWLQAREIRDIVISLLGLGGASTGVALTVPRVALSTVVEQVAWTIAGGCGGGLLAIGFGYVVFWGTPRSVMLWRRTFCKPPCIQVLPCSGRTAVLEITNVGGRGSLTAWGRIISVSRGSVARKEDSYPMLWRPDWADAIIQAPQGAVSSPNGPPLKMLIAAHEVINHPAVGVNTILALFGGPGKVDAIHIDPKHGSPIVTLEVRIISEPPLSHPFTQRYVAEIPPDYQSGVELKEVKP